MREDKILPSDTSFERKPLIIVFRYFIPFPSYFPTNGNLLASQRQWLCPLTLGFNWTYSRRIEERTQDENREHAVDDWALKKSHIFLSLSLRSRTKSLKKNHLFLPLSLSLSSVIKKLKKSHLSLPSISQSGKEERALTTRVMCIHSFAHGWMPA